MSRWIHYDDHLGVGMHDRFRGFTESGFAVYGSPRCADFAEEWIEVETRTGFVHRFLYARLDIDLAVVERNAERKRWADYLAAPGGRTE